MKITVLTFAFLGLSVFLTTCLTDLPPLPIVDPVIVLVDPNDFGESDVSTVTFTWQRVSNAFKYQLWLDGALLTTVKDPSAGLDGDQQETLSLSYTTVLPFDPPEHSWKLVVFFPLRTFESEQWSFTLNDTTEPTIEITSPKEDYLVTGHEISVAGSAADNESVAYLEVQLDGGIRQRVDVPSWPARSGKWETKVNIKTIRNNTPFEVTVTVYDSAGNTAEDTRSFRKSFIHDINGDNLFDIVVGSPYSYIGGLNSGRFSVIQGGATLPPYPNVAKDGDPTGERLGTSVAHAGDVNGDGYGDIIVGAEKNNHAGTNSGQAYLYFGKETFFTEYNFNTQPSPDVILDDSEEGDYFGTSVAGIGDINGDGFDDVAVGATQKGKSAGKGAVYIYFGEAIMDDRLDLTIPGAVVGDQFGFSIDFAGDVDQDGFNDFIVGAPYNESDSHLQNIGSVYIFNGGDDFDAIPDYRYKGTKENGHFGFSVSGGFDVNGDGNTDVLVGAPDESISGLGDFAGAAYLFAGSTSSDDDALLRIPGALAPEGRGCSVDIVGDMNNDGFADYIVGANYNSTNELNAGAAYFYLGAKVPTSEPLWSLVGTHADDELGFGVTGTGDLNHDGYLDFIVGLNKSDGIDGADTDSGILYFFYGGESISQESISIINGYGAWGRFGFTLD